MSPFSATFLFLHLLFSSAFESNADCDKKTTNGPVAPHKLDSYTGDRSSGPSSDGPTSLPRPRTVDGSSSLASLNSLNVSSCHFEFLTQRHCAHPFGHPFVPSRSVPSPWSIISGTFVDDGVHSSANIVWMSPRQHCGNAASLTVSFGEPGPAQSTFSPPTHAILCFLPLSRRRSVGCFRIIASSPLRCLIQPTGGRGQRLRCWPRSAAPVRAVVIVSKSASRPSKRCISDFLLFTNSVKSIRIEISTRDECQAERIPGCRGLVQTDIVFRGRIVSDAARSSPVIVSNRQIAKRQVNVCNYGSNHVVGAACE